jgi:hypothetical protein
MTSQSSFNIATGATITETYLDGITQHLLTTETGTPSTVFEGKEWVRTDLEQLVRYTGSAAETFDGYGAWTAYTPTHTGSVSDPTTGNGTLTGGYRHVGGRAVAFWALFTQGTTSVVGAGNGVLALGLPFAMASTTTATFMLNTTAYDVSANVHYPGVCFGAKTTTEMYIGSFVTNATYATIAGFVPGTQFVTAAGDYWGIGGVYEATS